MDERVGVDHDQAGNDGPVEEPVTRCVESPVVDGLEGVVGSENVATEEGE